MHAGIFKSSPRRGSRDVSGGCGGWRRQPTAADSECQGGPRLGLWPAGRGGASRPLLGLVLYLVPAAAALAWLAVGATAAWWGLSREPRGSRALSSLVWNARRRRTLLASPPAKSAANGNLLEPRSPLEGPDPAELLPHGQLPGQPGPPQPAPAPEARDVRERPGRRPPRPHRVPGSVGASPACSSSPVPPPLLFSDPPGGLPAGKITLILPTASPLSPGFELRT